MRLALIGPVLPFRGGIAQHTSALARALRVEVETHVVSFTRMYPRAIYPGKTDERIAGAQAEPAEFVLDAVDPRSWRRLVTRLERLRPDAAVAPWWTWFHAPMWAYLGKALRQRGSVVITYVMALLIRLKLDP